MARADGLVEKVERVFEAAESRQELVGRADGLADGLVEKVERRMVASGGSA